jgi:tRNA pseudouridine55 synthase
MSRVFGLLNVNKPSGPTSHDIVMGARRGSGERRVGHAGTLDPLAEGVLVLALGKATRLVEYLIGSPKRYVACIRLGIQTDTYDAEGEIIAERPVQTTQAEIGAALDALRGEVMQTPPPYSAIKVSGRPAYARVRAGQDVRLAPRPVTIHALQPIAFEPPDLRLEVECSAGTYIRSLAHDLGQILGCGAMLSGLVRTASGMFSLDEAVGWEALQDAFARGDWLGYLIPAEHALSGTPQVRLDDAGLRLIGHGQAVPSDEVSGGLGRAYAPDGRFVAVVEGDSMAGVWRPRKVFLDP